MSHATIHDAYNAAIAADKAYSVECMRVYGKNAAMRRYLAHDTGDAKLIAAMNAKLIADAYYFALCGTEVQS